MMVEKRINLIQNFRSVWMRTPPWFQEPARRLLHSFWQLWPEVSRFKLGWLQPKLNARVISQHQVVLKGILEKYQDVHLIIVFAPGLDWKIQLFQRPQHLAQAFARQGALVFYMQPRFYTDQPAFIEISDRLFLCNTLANTFELLENPIVYLLTWNADYRYQFRHARLLYDYVDDLDVFYGSRPLVRYRHRSLLKEARWVLTTAVRLHEEVIAQRADALLCPNGVVYEHFHVVGRSDPDTNEAPADIQPILVDGRPVVGYYGALARWFDYDLMTQVADMRPEYNFVLIGPDYDRTLRDQPLIQRSNVHWLGVKPYAELPGYLAYFAVATIPFVVNEITHATSPLKLFEYMAALKPVVITPMKESMRYPGVLVGQNAYEFALKLDEAIALRNDPGYLAEIEAVARENTWEVRARQIMENGLMQSE